MTSVSTTDSTKTVQGVTDTAPKVEEKPSSDKSSQFEAMFAKLVNPDQANMVNEEELFAAVIGDRISTLKGEEAAAKYQALLEAEKAALRKPNGYVSYEDAAMNALKGLRSSGLLSEEEADQVYSESFRAAQLDDNHTKLFDGRGGPGDPTMATADRTKALDAARLLIEQIIAGGVSATPKSLDSGDSAASGSSATVSGGSPVDGPEGFLWKPEGDHSKKLVILLPAALTGEIEKLVLKDLEDKVIEEGTYSGEGNGGREHFRFNKAGGDYPADLKVEVTLKDGTVKVWDIADPNERYD